MRSTIKIGVQTKAVETEPGIWEATIIEYPRKADIQRNIERRNASTDLSDQMSLNNSFSIVEDSVMLENVGKILYIMYKGSKWKVSSIDINRPRIIMYAGGLYV